MNTLMAILAEDTLAVLGFILFAAVLYNLIAWRLGRRFGRGRMRTFAEKRKAAGSRFFQKLFPDQTSETGSGSRKDFSRNISAENNFNRDSS